MGVYIKNADNDLKQKIGGTSFLQKELLSVLGEIWNNQDNLNEEDKQFLTKISQKGLYENINN